MPSTFGAGPRPRAMRVGGAAVPLIGRAFELSMLMAPIELARTGEPGPRLAVIRGDPGVGKSRLLEEARARAAGSGCLVLAGRAEDVGGQVPYALLADVLGPTLDAAPADARLTAEVDSVRRALTLRDHEVDRAAQLDPDGGPDAVAEDIARLLRALSSTVTCVLVLDDLHAADADTVAVVTRLLPRLRGLGCAVLAAVRQRPPDLPVALAASLERHSDAGSAALCNLEPLSADDAARLASVWLGAAPDAALAARLWESCRGNPIYLQQGICSLIEEGSLVPSPGGATVGSAAIPTLASASPVRLRLARLGPAVERTALVLAVLAAVDVHDLPLVAELAGLSVSDTERAFDVLVAAGSLEQTPGGRYGFSHPIVRETLHAKLGPAERRRLHGRIAAALQGRRAAGAPVNVLEIANHVVESAAPGDTEAVAVLAEAGTLAARRAPHTAVRLLRHALELLAVDAPGRAELLVSLATVLRTTGTTEEFVSVAQEAIGRLPPGPDCDWIAAATMSRLAYQGLLQEALAVADRVLTGHDVPMPSVSAEKARALIHLGRPEETLALAEPALRASTGGASRVAAVSLLADAAHSRGQVSTCEALFAAALKAVGAEPTVDRLALLCHWATVQASYGDPARARATMNEAETLHATLGGAIRSAAVHLRLARVGITWLEGRWDELLDEAERAPDDWTYTEEILQLLAADVYLERGELSRAAAIVDRLGPRPAVPPLWAWMAAGVAAANGDPVGGRRLLADAIDEAAKARLWGFSYRGLLRLVELEVAAGNLVAAADRLATLEWLAETVATPMVRVYAFRARGLVAGEPAPLYQALAVATEHGMAVQAALARLELGILGDSPAEHLRAAFEVFRRLGAERWRSQAGARLRALGIPVPRASRRAPGTLTDTELRLARSVADGRTNREMAEILSLSVGTVSTYLTRVFAKTRTANRRELGRLIREGGLGVVPPTRRPDERVSEGG